MTWKPQMIFHWYQFQSPWICIWFSLRQRQIELIVKHETNSEFFWKKNHSIAERFYISILEFSMWKIIFDFFKQNISCKKNDHITFWKFFFVYIEGTRDKY